MNEVHFSADGFESLLYQLNHEGLMRLAKSPGPRSVSSPLTISSTLESQMTSFLTDPQLASPQDVSGGSAPPVSGGCNGVKGANI